MCRAHPFSLAPGRFASPGWDWPLPHARPMAPAGHTHARHWWWIPGPRDPWKATSSSVTLPGLRAPLAPVGAAPCLPGPRLPQRNNVYECPMPRTVAYLLYFRLHSC